MLQKLNDVVRKLKMVVDVGNHVKSLKKDLLILLLNGTIQMGLKKKVAVSKDEPEAAPVEEPAPPPPFAASK